MAIRIVRLQSRNPVVAAALVILLIALVLAVLAVGITVLGALAVVGGAGLLARRALGLRRPAPPPLDRADRTDRLDRLDPSLEVHAPAARDAQRRLPPGAV